MQKKSAIGVLFDMDGVIFDSEKLILEGWQQVATDAGIPDIEGVLAQCFGTNEAATKKIFADHYGDDFPYDAHKAKVRTYFFSVYDALGHLPLKPGVADILSFLKQRHMKIVLATSTRAALAQKELADAGIDGYFDVVVGGDMVARSKPAPDIFLSAAEAIQLLPEDCYVIEDSYHGIRAAASANARPIMVPDQMAPDEEMANLAEQILSDLFEAKAYLERQI
jgi:HAD superfamily hydrolase (TIGR01509 family)